VHVTVASDGAQAVDVALSGDADAVFMACQMPGMDGRGATCRIRTVESGTLALIGSPLRTRLPIMAMTAGGLLSDRAACLAVGVNGFCPSPGRRSSSPTSSPDCGGSAPTRAGPATTAPRRRLAVT
jgi:CheY-like chemotaxis protein